MRIRKLAQEIGCSPEQVLGLLAELGHARYRSPEQQVPDPVAGQVRRRAGDLRKPAPAWVPPADSGPVRRFDDRAGARAKPPADPADRAALDRALEGVRPLNATPAAKKPAPRPLTRVPVGPAVAAGPAAPGGIPGAGAAAAGALPVAGLDELRALVEAERASLQAEREATAGEREATRVERAELQAERREVATERAEVRAEREALRAERASLLDRALAAESELARVRAGVDAGAGRAGEVPTPTSAGPVSARRVLEARGLRGDDEIGATLAAFAATHRARELVDLLAVPDPDALDALLHDRVVLVGPGQEAPAGLVPVVVPDARSEAAEAPAVRAAVARLVTALLVNGLRRLCVVGGPGALHRVLREALDPRIELRQFVHVPGGAVPDVPQGSVVALWAEAAGERRLVEAFPHAARAPGRELPRLCEAIVEALHSR